METKSSYDLERSAMGLVGPGPPVKLILPPDSRRRGERDGVMMEGFVCPECLVALPSADGLSLHFEQEHGGGAVREEREAAMLQRAHATNLAIDRTAHESRETAAAVMGTLSDQADELDRIDQRLEDIDLTVRQSARVARGLTFFGRIANAFSRKPKGVDVSSEREEKRAAADRRAAERMHHVEAAAAAERAERADGVTGGRELGARATRAQQDIWQTQEAGLNALADAGRELMAMGHIIGDEITQQADRISDTGDRIESINARMDRVKRKVVKLT